MRLAVLLLLALGWRSASAQPRADAVVAAWQDGWEQAYSGGEVQADEQSLWTLDGPRGPVRVQVDGQVTYQVGQMPTRTVTRLRIGDRDLEPEAGRRYERRVGRAFGRGGRTATAPPPLPDRLLTRTQASRLVLAVLDETLAWRVTLASRRGQALAWFTRSERAPRLLATRTEQSRDGRRLVQTVRYVRVEGLDLPSAVEAELTVRQRRRLRDYVVTLSAAGTYSGHRVR